MGWTPWIVDIFNSATPECRNFFMETTTCSEITVTGVEWTLLKINYCYVFLQKRKKKDHNNNNNLVGKKRDFYECMYIVQYIYCTVRKFV